jgi:hypothetical protein
MRTSLLAVLALVFAACTPEQGQSVPLTQLFTDAKLHKKYVSVTGVLTLSSGIMGSTSCTASRCKIELSVPDKGWKPPKDTRSTVVIEVAVGSGKNEMAELPAKYTRADLKVKTMDGKVLGHGSSAKLSGSLDCHGNNGEDWLPCKLHVERVDAS